MLVGSSAVGVTTRGEEALPPQESVSFQVAAIFNQMQLRAIFKQMLQGHPSSGLRDQLRDPNQPRALKPAWLHEVSRSSPFAYKPCLYV